MDKIINIEISLWQVAAVIVAANILGFGALFILHLVDEWACNRRERLEAKRKSNAKEN